MLELKPLDIRGEAKAFSSLTSQAKGRDSGNFYLFSFCASLSRNQYGQKKEQRKHEPTKGETRKTRTRTRTDFNSDFQHLGASSSRRGGTTSGRPNTSTNIRKEQTKRNQKLETRDKSYQTDPNYALPSSYVTDRAIASSAGVGGLTPI